MRTPVAAAAIRWVLYIRQGRPETGKHGTIRGQSGRHRVQASQTLALSAGQLSRAKSLANQAQVLVLRASGLTGQPPLSAHADSSQTSKIISAKFTAHRKAWERDAHELRASLRQSSQQLLEARQTNEVLNAQLDSMRLLLEQSERQRNEALAVAPNRLNQHR